MSGLSAAAGLAPRGWSLRSACTLLLAAALALCSLSVAHDAGEVSERGFLFHDDDAPYSLPMDIYVPMIGLNGNGARSVKFDAAAISQSLFNSLPAARPSCLQNGRHLHAQYLLNYHVYHANTDAVTAVERLIAEHMRPATDSDGNPVTAPLFIPAPHHTDGLADAMYLDEDEEPAAVSGSHARRGERPGQHVVVPVFDVELSEIEAALDGIVINSLETEMRGIGIDTQVHRPFHESSVVILNPDKERLRDFMRPSELVTLKNPLDGDRTSLPFVYRYRYNGGAPTKQWIGYGRHVFMDLTALPTSFGSSTTGEGTVGKDTIPQVETALDHKVSSSLHSPEEIVELYSAAEAAAARQGSPGVAPSTRFASRLVSATIHAVRKVFVADVRFSKIEYAERIVVPIIVLRNHDQFSPFTTDAPLPGEDGRFDDMKIDLSVLRFELKQMLLPSQDLVLTTMTRSIYDHRHLSSSVFNALTEDTVHTPAPAGATTGAGNGYVARTIPYLDSEVLISQLVASSSSDALLTAVIEEHRTSRTRAEAEARAYRAAQGSSIPGRVPHPDEGLDEEALSARETALADADAAAIERTLTEARKGSRNAASSTSSHVKAGKSLGVARDRRKAWDKQTDKVIKSWQHRAYADSVLSGSLAGKQRVIPVFVYSLLGLPEGVLLDRTHLATPSARGSLIVALQTLAPEVPVPYFTEDGPVTVSARNPTREIVGSLVSAIGGVVPPYVSFQPERKRLTFDYTWAIGQHAFGPFATTTAVSQVFQDAVLRNSVMTRLSGTVKLVKTAVHEIARFHRHFIADPLAAELASEASRAAALAGPDATADATALMAMGTASASDASVMGPDAWFASLKQYRHYAKSAMGAVMAASAVSTSTAAISPFAQAVLLSLVSDLERLDKDLQGIAPLLAEFKWDLANAASAKLVSRALAFRHKVDDEISSARYELSCCRKVYSVHGEGPSLGTLAKLSSDAAAATAAVAERGKSITAAVESVAASAATGGMQRLRAAAAGSAATAAHISASIKATSLLDQGPLVLAGIGFVVLLIVVCVVGVFISLRRKRSASKAAAGVRTAAATVASSGVAGSGGSINGPGPVSASNSQGFGNEFGDNSGGFDNTGFGNAGFGNTNSGGFGNASGGFNAAPPAASPFGSSMDSSASDLASTASDATRGTSFSGRSFPAASPSRSHSHSVSGGAPVPTPAPGAAGVPFAGFGGSNAPPAAPSSGYASASPFGAPDSASGSSSTVRPTSLSMSGRAIPVSSPFAAAAAAPPAGSGYGQFPAAPLTSSLSAASAASAAASSSSPTSTGTGSPSPVPAFPSFPASAHAQAGATPGSASGSGSGLPGGFGVAPGAPMPPLSGMHAQYSRPMWTAPASATAAAGSAAPAASFAARPAPLTAPASGAPAGMGAPAPAFAPFAPLGSTASSASASSFASSSTGGSSVGAGSSVRSGPSPVPAFGGFPTPSLPAMPPRSPQQPAAPASAQWPPSTAPPATSTVGSASGAVPRAFPAMPSFTAPMPGTFGSAPAQHRSLGAGSAAPGAGAGAGPAPTPAWAASPFAGFGGGATPSAPGAGSGKND